MHGKIELLENLLKLKLDEKLVHLEQVDNKHSTDLHEAREFKLIIDRM